MRTVVTCADCHHQIYKDSKVTTIDSNQAREMRDMMSPFYCHYVRTKWPVSGNYSNIGYKLSCTPVIT